MKIIHVRTRLQLEQCVDMYLGLNDESFLPSSRTASLSALFTKIRTNKFVRAIELENRIIAWIYADVVKLEHTDYKCFQQFYYASDQVGVKAFRCINLLHSEMINEARKLKVKYCVSYGSHMDPSNTFVRILEKSGWKRRGHIAIFEMTGGGSQEGTD